MKRMFVLIGLAAGIFADTTASPLLIETYQNEYVEFHLPARGKTATVAQLSFSVDTNCCVQFTAGGRLRQTLIFLKLDGERLYPEAMTTHPFYTYPYSIVYNCALKPGEHTLSLQAMDWFLLDTSDSVGICDKSYLQALLLLPDKVSPPQEIDESVNAEVQPSGALPTLISNSAYVRVPGASQLVDASGRIVETSIAEGMVHISTLGPGTYFARSGERTVVKIVKVD